jgi:hypothetical protein
MNDLLNCYLSAISLYKYDKAADEFIDLLLTRLSPIVFADNYWAVFKLRNKYVKVWIANRWYGYGTTAEFAHKPYADVPDLWMTEEVIYNNSRISRKNKLRLYRYVMGYKETTEANPLLLLNNNLKKEVNL